MRLIGTQILLGIISLLSLLSAVYLHSTEGFRADDYLVISSIIALDVSLILFIVISLKMKTSDYVIKFKLLPNVYRLISVPFVLYFIEKFTDLAWLNVYTVGVVVFMFLLLISTFIHTEKSS